MKITKIFFILLPAFVLCQTGITIVLGQTNDPIVVTSRTILTNNATYFKDKSRVPSLLGGGKGESPVAATNFLALDGLEDYVPDTHGTVGQDYVMTMLNTKVSLQTKGGNTLMTNTLNDFWGYPTETNPIAVFDPRMTYDPFNNRWIAIAAAYGKTTNSQLLLAVSLTSNPTNGWNIVRQRTDTNGVYWADSPTVGFNKDWIVAQANMGIVDGAIGTNQSRIWVFNKTNLYGGGSNSPTLFIHEDPGSYLLSFSEIPAVTYDNSLSTVFLLQNANGNNNGSGCLRLFSITGNIGSESLNFVTNPMYIRADGATWRDLGNYRCCSSPQTNWTDLATAVDARPTSVIYRNGFLWCAQTIFFPNTGQISRASVQWWQLKPDTREIIQRGRIEDGVKSYSFPSIAVNRFNDVLIGHNSFSTNQHPSANYAFRAFYDEVNVMRSTRIYKSGESVFGAQTSRWGDYSASMVDPSNDSDFWTIQEYSLTNTVDIFGSPISIWGTRWARVNVDVPTNDNFAAAVLLSGTSGTNYGTNIRATRESGEPFHAGITNNVSVWYKWTAPSDGNTVFTVNGNFDTALAAYQGTGLTNLSAVASNHGGVYSSQMSFNAQAAVQYWLAVDGFGIAPNNQWDFTLLWSQPSLPIFTLQPSSRDLYMTSNVTFAATAVGNPTPTYQWRFNSVNIAGATQSSYTKNNIQTNDTGDYTVVASNTSGSVTSQVAHLQVYTTQQALITEPSYGTNLDYIRFLVSGITGATYVVQASTNLVNWSPVQTNITTFTNISYDLTNYPYRFYRILYVP